MSALRKRSVTIKGHRTSFSLEDQFLAELAALAKARCQSMASLIAEVDGARTRGTNLSSALRLEVLAWLKSERDSSRVRLGQFQEKCKRFSVRETKTYGGAPVRKKR